MPQFRLLAVDIDGTLVNSSDELTADTRAALRRAGLAGIRVVLATGRRYSRTLPLVEPLGIDVPLVTAGGALVKDPADHRTLFQARFAPEVLRATLEAIDRAGFAPLLCGDTFGEGFDYYVAREDGHNPAVAEYLALNPGCGRLWPTLIRKPPPDAFMGFTMGTREEMLALDAAIHRVLPGALATNVLRSPRYKGFLFEFSPSGVTKWSGVCHLAEGWRISSDEICAVGDDVNDLPMIRAAGLGVAMGNAQPHVRQAADRIAPTHDEDGLVQVVEWLLAAGRDGV